MHVLSCPERDELEKQLNEALRELSEASRHASNLARENGVALQFVAIQAQHDILTERIRVLRECLHLHKDWHGC
jgi:hypothetical protein